MKRSMCTRPDRLGMACLLRRAGLQKPNKEIIGRVMLSGFLASFKAGNGSSALAIQKKKGGKKMWEASAIHPARCLTSPSP